MVSIPCNPTAAARLPKLPLSVNTTRLSHLHRPPSFHICRAAPHPTTASGGGAAPDPPERQREQLRTMFPGGFKRPEIKVPTLVLRLSAEEVLGGEGSSAAAEISAAVSRGVGIVMLNDEDDSGGRIYEAACILRSAIGDRAYLLISERVDVAAAVGASGVVLSDKGIPTIVARNMLMKSRSDAIYLPLVARTVLTLDSALTADSSEGADFLIMRTVGENCARVIDDSVIKHMKVPIFFTIPDITGDNLSFNVTSKLLQSGACGIVISLNDMKLFSDNFLQKIFSTSHGVDRILHTGSPNSSRLEMNDVRVFVDGKKGIAGFTKLNDKEIQLIEAESLILHEAIAVIRKAAPTMKEVSLLVDAASCLSEPFLLVIVGEFNSGKSTVINALLGRRYLKDGVVPTTNEITVLCYSEMESSEQERCERHPDGQFLCYLPAPILKEMSLVDTPGTNVILQRQQRLTEEFVPRADLVLFVLSSDRPLTESEVAFLLYVQQWKKKVVFVLNKLDIYRNASELEEATSFIKENTWKLLNTEHVRLYPVSARLALEAKLSALANGGRSYEQLLYNDPLWISSRFYELEKFLFSFLDGSTDTGMERMRLKLETPLGIADRLLISCERLVKQEYEDAKKDLISITEVLSSVKEYHMKMETESILWKKQTSSLIESAKMRAVNLIETILQLSNIDLIATYAFKGKRSNSTLAFSAIQNEILSPALSDIQRLLKEYAIWLQSNNAREGKLYVERINECWHAVVEQKDKGQSETYGLVGKGEELSITVIENFSASAAARLLEEEIREVVLGTFGGLGAAGLSASLLTSVLPTTLEDLLALTFCSAGGLLAVSNFPARRNETIEKVKKVADGLAREIEEAMQNDLAQTTDKLKHYVEVISKPYQEAAQRRINRLLEVQDELANIERKLRDLRTEIQNLHPSAVGFTGRSG